MNSLPQLTGSAKVTSANQKIGAHTMTQSSTISIDLAKFVFQVAIFNRHGKRMLNQAMSKKKMLRVICQHPGSTICIEACAASHYWGRIFKNSGHTIKITPPQKVTPYRSGNKNDADDAIAIYEASLRLDILLYRQKHQNSKMSRCYLA